MPIIATMLKSMHRLAIAAAFCVLCEVAAAQQTRAVSCESVAAVVDGRALDASLYAILASAVGKTSTTIYSAAPITGGRYWVRADYGDGRAVKPYPHFGCFADIRIAIAWFCGADKDYVKSRASCTPARRGPAVELPAAGCVSIALSLREPIIYCAPGSSPDVVPPA